MKKYTKWLALLLCGALLLSGCGSAKDDDKDDDKPDQTVESDENEPDEDSPDDTETEPTAAPDDVVPPEATPEPTDTPVIPDEPTTTEAPVAETLFPIVSIHPHQRIWYADDQTTELLTADTFTLYVENDGFNALQNSFNEQHFGINDDDYTEILSWAIDHYTTDSSSFWGYYSSIEAEMSRCDSNIVSLRITYSDYTGGAHGMYAYAGETYDTKTGQLLYLDDIIADVEGFYPLAVDYIIDALYAEYEDGLFSDYQTQVSSSIVPGSEPNWYLSGSGIVISFSPYEVGPYAMGAPEVTLPYETFGEYIKEDYLLPQGVFAAQISENQDFSYIIGSSEPAFIGTTTDEWGMNTVTIYSGSVTIDVGQFSYATENYITRHSNGRCFLILSGDRMSGDYETHIYEVSRGAVRECAYLSNAYPDKKMITPEKWSMIVRMDILGTYGGSVTYNLSSTGEFTRTDDIYSISTEHALEIIKPLPVIIDNTETTLPVGEKIVVVGTNNIDEVYFQIEGTNQYGTLCFTRQSQDWIGVLINGIPEMEYFKNLPYAG